MIYTVGHGARSLDALVAVLREAGVSVLLDIRRYPGSRHHPQFGRRSLAAALEAAGIGYEWHGEALGGRRPHADPSRHTALRDPGLGGYADHMDSAEFRDAVKELVARAEGGERPAIMCAETQWQRCHRQLVADALEMHGVHVVHLLEVGRREQHRPHPTVRRGDDGWPIYDVPDTLPGLG